MCKHLLPILTVFLLSSCVTYQYFTVDSTQLPKDDHQSFTMENDTLRLTYTFSGNGGPVTITVYNKTTQPLFINWNKSALICNDQSYSLAQHTSTFLASSERSGYRTADLEGTVNINPSLEVVPAQTRVSRSTIYLEQTIPQLRAFLPDSAAKHWIKKPDDGALLSYRMAEVGENQSPLRMKSYLTLVMGPGNGIEFVMSHTFYIGKIMLTRYGPDQFILYHAPGDQFYITSPQNPHTAPAYITRS